MHLGGLVLLLELVLVLVLLFLLVLYEGHVLLVHRQEADAEGALNLRAQIGTSFFSYSSYGCCFTILFCSSSSSYYYYYYDSIFLGIVDLRERLPHRLLQRHPLCLTHVVDKMRDELRVRLRAHRVPGSGSGLGKVSKY